MQLLQFLKKVLAGTKDIPLCGKASLTRESREGAERAGTFKSNRRHRIVPKSDGTYDVGGAPVLVYGYYTMWTTVAHNVTYRQAMEAIEESKDMEYEEWLEREFRRKNPPFEV